MAAAFSELLYVVVVVVVVLLLLLLLLLLLSLLLLLLLLLLLFMKNMKAGQILNFILQVRSSSVARKSLRELLHEFYGLTLAYEEEKWWCVAYSAYKTA